MPTLTQDPTLGWLIVKQLTGWHGTSPYAVLRVLGHVTADYAASVLASYRR